MNTKQRTTDTATRFKIGSNIRKWRNLREIKQKDLARSLNLSEAAVSNIENDVTNLTITQLEDISTALDVSIELLLADPQQNYQHPGKQSNMQLRTNITSGIDKELVNAMLSSLEKKDQQLQTLMQQFLFAVNEFTVKYEHALKGATNSTVRV